ncbi:hypothetical protein DSO57_1003956 [Entomophthora muscae]|uniref:Uncharacterized protein n=1 Tax=Entomophthora muscae TaxID=34485 RepID=A0ACC2RZH4_9FUNG|nr:hypothetical protein DSO57_1003956 [Entomophthora muscae]
MANTKLQSWLEDFFLDVPDFSCPSAKKHSTIPARKIVVLQAYPCTALVHKCSVRRFHLDAADCKGGTFPPELESKTNTVCLIAIKKMEFLQSLDSTQMSGHDIHDLPNLSTDLDTLELWKHSPLDTGLQKPTRELTKLSSSSLLASTNRLNVCNPFVNENIHFSAWIVPIPQLKLFRSSLAISPTHGFADPKPLAITRVEPQQADQSIGEYSHGSAALIIDSSDYDDIFFSSP